MWPFLILISALLFGSLAEAWETDQYTLPPQPIADTGEEISYYIYKSLLESIHLANLHRITYPDKIKQLKIQIAEKKGLLIKIDPFLTHPKMKSQKSRLKIKINQLQDRLQHYTYYDAHYYQTPKGMAELITKLLGGRISLAEKDDAIWGKITELTPYLSGIKGQKQIAFDPGKLGSVYAFAGFHRILHPSHFVFSSTIKLYSIEIGMDKLGHLFNEGFQYYHEFNQAKEAGDSDYLALQKAVAWGVDTENSYYGRWVSGIYSNADLASNYAGLHFYFNLFSPLIINGVKYPALLLQNERGDYLINRDDGNQPQELLKRFISYHMNEAFNPSSLEYLQYIVVKEAVKNRCLLWEKKYPNLNVLNEKLTDLARWNGDEYGFNSENTISIYDSCFTSSNFQSQLL